MMLVKTNTSRIEYLDLLKGFGIIIMIMGHIGFTEPFNHYIHAFNMPLFYIITGYLFNTTRKETFSGFATKKAKKLLIPYFFFGTLNIVIAIITINDFDLKSAIVHLLWENNKGLAMSGAIWFLSSLFFACIVFYFLRFIHSEYMKAFLVLSVTTIGLLLTINLPFSLNSALVGIGFMYVGHIIKSNAETVEKVRNKFHLTIVLVVAVINMIIILNSSFVNMRKNEYGIALLFIINALIAVYCFWMIAISLCIQKNTWVIRAREVIRFIGANSIIYLATNEIIIKLFNNFIVIENASLIIKLMYKISVLISVCVIDTIVLKLMKRLKISFLVGQ